MLNYFILHESNVTLDNCFLIKQVNNWTIIIILLMKTHLYKKMSSLAFLNSFYFPFPWHFHIFLCRGIHSKCPAKILQVLMLCSRGAFHFKITMHYTALIWGSQTLFGIRDFNSTSWNKSGGLNVMGVANQVFSLCFWTSQWTRTQKGLVRTQILLPVQPYKAESLWREFWVAALKRSFVFVYVHEIHCDVWG